MLVIIFMFFICFIFRINYWIDTKMVRIYEIFLCIGHMNLNIIVLANNIIHIRNLMDYLHNKQNGFKKSDTWSNLQNQNKLINARCHAQLHKKIVSTSLYTCNFSLQHSSSWSRICFSFQNILFWCYTTHNTQEH